MLNVLRGYAKHETIKDSTAAVLASRGFVRFSRAAPIDWFTRGTQRT